MTTAQAAKLVDDVEARSAMSLMAGGVPLSLLIDLVQPVPSAEIVAREGGDANWLTNVA